MGDRLKNLGIGGVALAAVIGLPAVGAKLAGRDLSDLLDFPPPLEIPTDFPGWSWTALVLVAAPLLALGFAFRRSAASPPSSVDRPRSPVLRPPSSVLRPPSSVLRPPPSVPRPLPSWGWAAFVWTGAWWLIAWVRPAAVGPLREFTFFPLWIGLIVAANALAWRRAGSCGMTRDPRGWLRLFVVSALFWWLFEWLNRFVHNWHYLGVEDYTAGGYAVHATVCFSTVLPAVAAVSEWLGTHDFWHRSWARGPAWPVLTQPRMGWVLIAAALAALVMTGSWPLQLYASLWVAPLALAMGLGIVTRREGFWNDVAAGDWRRAVRWMSAALVCGFLWELWNWQSMPKWIYTVPYFDRWHLFEMPLPGFAGYLPFGLECLLVHDLVRLRTDAGTAH